MSARGLKSERRNQRTARRSRLRISADSARDKPTKLSKPGFVGFVGASWAERAIIRNPSRDLRRSLIRRPHRPSGGATAIQVDLDYSAKTTRLMSWSGPKTDVPKWRGGVAPAKAEA